MCICLSVLFNTKLSKSIFRDDYSVSNSRSIGSLNYSKQINKQGDGFQSELGLSDKTFTDIKQFFIESSYIY